MGRLRAILEQRQVLALPTATLGTAVGDQCEYGRSRLENPVWNRRGIGSERRSWNRSFEFWRFYHHGRGTAVHCGNERPALPRIRRGHRQRVMGDQTRDWV